MRSIYLVSAIIVLITFFPENTYSRTPKSSYMSSSMWNNNIKYITSSENEIWRDDENFLVHDPIYYFNKIMFNINDKLYLTFLTPIISAYKMIIPLPVRTSIKNFFHNITMPARFINCLLQGKGNAAQAEMARFIINSTFGIGGLLTPASKYPELNPPIEDLGQTLGSYNIGNGFYIVWPIIGISTLRDSIGMLGDWFLNPINYIEHNLKLDLPITSIKAINNFSFEIDQYEAIKKIAFDPYESFRDAYIQNRNAKIAE